MPSNDPNRKRRKRKPRSRKDNSPKQRPKSRTRKRQSTRKSSKKNGKNSRRRRLVGRRRGTLPRVKNTKVTGERSEANFLYKAANRNFGIAKPWGDSRKYDFILDSGSLLNRMQIKCTECIRAGAYETRATYTVGKGRAVYTKKDIDFIAAHVVPLDIWYIIPVEVCTRQPMLRFYPHRKAKNMRLEKYREAWHLLTAPEDHETIEIQAVADETIYSDLDTEDLRALLTELKDPAAPGRMKKNGKNKTGKKKTGKKKTEKKKTARSKPVRLPKSAAPWPIPALKVLKARTGKRILPDPNSN